MPPVTKSRIIVLHLTKHSESGVVLHTLDADAGRRSFLVRGLKSNRSALAAFHSLSLLDVVSAESPKSSLAWLREWTPVQPLHGIRGDLVKGSVAMFVSEVLYRSFTTELSDPQLFDWLCDSVAALDAETGGIANYPIWFLVNYAVRLGFMPGETIEPAGLFPPDEAALFYRILRSPYETVRTIPLTAARRQSFARRMLQYLSWHLGITIDARSLDVLHEVLA